MRVKCTQSCTCTMLHTRDDRVDAFVKKRHGRRTEKEFQHNYIYIKTVQNNNLKK